MKASIWLVTKAVALPKATVPSICFFYFVSQLVQRRGSLAYPHSYALDLLGSSKRNSDIFYINLAFFFLEHF